MEKDSMENPSEFSFEPTFFHSNEWITLLQSVYAYDRLDIKLDGFSLPLLRVAPIFGDRLISIPFSDYGGPVGAVDTVALTQSAKTLLNTTHADYVELRSTHRKLVDTLLRHAFTLTSTYFSRVVDTLPQDSLEDVWRHTPDKKARQGVAKARKAGLTVREAKTKSEIRDVYNVYFKVMKKMGSPTHPRIFFERLKDTLPDTAKIYLAEKDGKPVGMAVYLIGRGKLHLWARCALEEYKELGAIYLLDWTGIELAHTLGVGKFDFGRTRKESGVEVYKHHWRGVDIDIYHLCLPRKEAVNPPDPLQPRFQFYAKMWRVLPDSVVRVIGPRVIRCIAL
ncbi:MAG: GNAT family N-acetyltransferase [Thermoprotei archaeon]